MTRNNAGISVYARKFILDLLKEHGMAGCKAIDTPLGGFKFKLGYFEGSK